MQCYYTRGKRFLQLGVSAMASQPPLFTADLSPSVNVRPPPASLFLIVHVSSLVKAKMQERRGAGDPKS
jgi:hypothetical protein